MTLFIFTELKRLQVQYHCKYIRTHVNKFKQNLLKDHDIKPRISIIRIYKYLFAQWEQKRKRK